MKAIAELILGVQSRDEFAIMQMGFELPAVPYEGAGFCFPGVSAVLGIDWLVLHRTVWNVSGNDLAAIIHLTFDYECDMVSDLQECAAALRTHGWKQKIFVGEEVNQC